MTKKVDILFIDNETEAEQGCINVCFQIARVADRLVSSVRAVYSTTPCPLHAHNLALTLTSIPPPFLTNRAAIHIKRPRSYLEWPV